MSQCTTVRLLMFLGGLAMTLNCQDPVRQQDKATGEISEQKLKECGDKMHTEFPSGTRSLNLYEVTGWLDDLIRLKVEIDKKDLDAFIKGSPFSEMELDGHNKYVENETSLPWWKPGYAKQFKSAEAALPDAKYLKILIDLDDETKAIIYLMWMET